MHRTKITIKTMARPLQKEAILESLKRTPILHLKIDLRLILAGHGMLCSMHPHLMSDQFHHATVISLLQACHMT